MAKWISVKDKLPEVDNPVLVTNNDYLGMTIACLDDNGKWYDESRGIEINVTHWRKLPKGPKRRLKDARYLDD